MPAAALLRGYIELTNFMFELERQRLGCWKDLRWCFSALRCLPQRNDIFAEHWPKNGREAGLVSAADQPT